VAIAQSRAHSVRARETLSTSHARVRQAEHIIVETLRLLEQLRDAVAALARVERSNAVPPEKVIVLLEQLVIEADAEWPHPAGPSSLLSEVVRWGVEAYYAA